MLQNIDIQQIIVAVVVALCGILPALLQGLASRASRKTTAHRLEQLSTDLDFIERWSKLSREQQSGAEPAPALQLQGDLDRVLRQYRALKARDAHENIREFTEISFLRRMFLLFTPASPKAWIYHTVFYVVVLFSTVMLVEDWRNPTFDPETGQNEFVYLLTGFLLLFGLPAILLVRKANQERKRQIELHRSHQET
jgi:hypothetical protein